MINNFKIKRLLIGFAILLIAGGIYLFQSRGVKIKKQKAGFINFVNNGENIRNIKELSKIWQVIQTGTYDYYLISFFKDICMTCPSGIIIKKLKDIYKLYEQLNILALLSDDFTDRDIHNLKVNLGIEFQLEKASKELSDKWNKWIKEYEKPRLNYIAFLMDKRGNIIETLKPLEENKFFRFIESQINKETNNDKKP